MRVKTGFSRRRHHKEVLSRTKGFRMTKHRLYRVAREADLHAGQYAYSGRKSRKRDMRRLWIMRINAALRENGYTYSRAMRVLKEKNIEIDRKILADLAVSDQKTFKLIFETAFAK